MAQQLLDSVPGGGVKVAFDGSISELNDNFFRVGRMSFAQRPVVFAMREVPIGLRRMGSAQALKRSA
jgi:hypothetical protein